MPAKRLTTTIINERIRHRGIELIGEFKLALEKTDFKCSYGHVWKALPSNVMAGNGCPHCSNRAKLSKSIVDERLLLKGIQMIGDYINVSIKAEFKCLSGHTWTTSITNVLNTSGCPSCADYGGGFKPNKSAWEYAFIRDGYLKYGITNDLTRRLNEHMKYGKIELIHERYHESGHLALDWENHIKRTHGGRYATKEQCPDGYTETLPLSKLLELNFLIKNT